VAAKGSGGAKSGGLFRALRSQPFRRFYFGQSISASGTFIQATAIGWLVLRETGSAGTLGLVIAAGSLPGLLLGPWGGTMADRVDRRLLLLGTQTAFGLLAGALWVAALEGVASVSVIIAIGVLSGLVSVVDAPARQAFVAALVPADDLSSAVSLNGVVVNGSRVIGPAIAAVLIATVGTTPCFAANAASYVVAIGALLVVRPLSSGTRPHTGGVRDGLRFAAKHQQLWLPLCMMALVGLLAFNFAVTLPVLVQRVFHAGGGVYGLLTAILSAGSVLGSLSVGLLHHPRRIYLATAACAFGVALVGVALAPTVTICAVALFVTGITAFSFVTLTSTTLQLHAGATYRGRIMALFVLVYIGTTPIGSLVTGWISGSAGGPRAALLVGAAACVVAGGGAFLVHTPPHVDDQLTDPAPTTDLRCGVR
jgi:MFS family permease